MIEFKELGIKPSVKQFEGEKIVISRILNKKIIICDYIIDNSKFQEKGNGKCLKMQIIVDNFKRIIFTGSAYLQEMIDQVPKDKFPFQTTIINDNDSYQFT